uniref:Uncharacterized protein n=1 Tax=Manihot esculenta TaxID=3983 RepID=A0A2C9WMK7_MANES
MVCVQLFCSVGAPCVCDGSHSQRKRPSRLIFCFPQAKSDARVGLQLKRSWISWDPSKAASLFCFAADGVSRWLAILKVAV